LKDHLALHNQQWPLFYAKCRMSFQSQKRVPSLLWSQNKMLIYIQKCKAIKNRPNGTTKFPSLFLYYPSPVSKITSLQRLQAYYLQKLNAHFMPPPITNACTICLLKFWCFLHVLNVYENAFFCQNVALPSPCSSYIRSSWHKIWNL